MRSLVIAPQWIGDAVMTEPLMRALAANGEKITVAALPWVAPVYRAMPQIQQVIELPFQHGGLQWQARKKLGQSLTGQFDVAYVLPNSFKSALIPFWANIPTRIGYQGEMRWALLNKRLANPSKTNRPPMVAFYSALAQLSPLAQSTSAPALAACSRSSHQAALPPELYPVLAIPAQQQTAHLQKLALSPNAYYVFAPGAEFGPAKRWPASHFAALLSSLDAPVFILGSAKESALAAQIIQQASGSQAALAQNLAGKTSLDEALSVIANAKAVFSNDSGLMHVAASFSVPQVAMYGSSSPLHTPPLNQQAAVLWLKNNTSYQPVLDCAPCFKRECPLGHTRCLNDITVEQVQQALVQLFTQPLT